MAGTLIAPTVVISLTEIAEDVLSYNLRLASGYRPFPGTLKMFLLFSEIKVLVVLYIMPCTLGFSQTSTEKRVRGWSASVGTHLGSAVCYLCGLGKGILLLLVSSLYVKPS